ncbi:MAG: aa3-type cytochrome c oxidase subunit IV [Rubellimicrobium sp.]|nr:aa3-type cytochrome c oxidase subunit IV [Rubellimicrobium sp.]
MAEHAHVPGSMDITAKEAAFAGFVKFATRAAILAVVVLVFLALANA